MSEKIKALREKHGLTLEQVGEIVGVGKSTVRKWETGQIANMRRDKIAALAKALHTTPAYLMGWKEETNTLPSNAIPYTMPKGYAPILGTIPAGVPTLAYEDIEGHEPIDYSDEENYFWLRIRGDSMVNAGIQTGDLVLIRKQPYAENGQIVACRVNGDEATLKRFRKKSTHVMLVPENSEYEPILVPAIDFENGEASIIGIAIEVKHKLL